MNPSVTITVDAERAAARIAQPLVLGNTYAVTFAGLSDDAAAASPEVIVLGCVPGEIAARSDADGNLAMNTTACASAFRRLPPPPFPPLGRPREFPAPPPTPTPPVHGAARPHGSVRLHFYVVADGVTLAQGDLTLLWAPFAYDEAGEPIQLQGKKGDKGDPGDKGDKGDRGANGVYAHAPGCVGFDVDANGHLWARSEDADTLLHGGDPAKPHYIIDTATGSPTKGHLLLLYYRPGSDAPQAIDLGSVVGAKGDPGDKGDPLTWDDLTPEQKAALKGQKGNPGDKGDPLTWDDLTPEQKAALKGQKGDPGKDGKDGMTAEEIAALVVSTMGTPDDAPTAGSRNWVRSGGLWSVEQAIIARINAIQARYGSTMSYRGTVPTVSDLPDENLLGDVYNVAETGDNYAWTGSEWDKLSGVVDLSGKQDVITDLDAIRSGAAAGATAYQKPASGIPATDLAPEAVPTVPTNVSAFANDAGYLTEHQSLANYVQKSQTAGLLKNDGTVDTTQYLTQHQDISGKLDAAARNLLPYAISASGVVLAPLTAVYRSELNADGTFPTITDTGIPTEDAYYQFELELAVPSTVPSTITGPSGWFWLDGHGLPDPADLSGGEKISVACRMNCTKRAVLASVWRVA